jgi:hypothetical protein
VDVFTINMMPFYFGLSRDKCTAIVVRPLNAAESHLFTNEQTGVHKSRHLSFTPYLSRED